MPRYTRYQGEGREMRTEKLPVFVTQRNRADLMGMYDEALLAWPVPSETMFVATRFGHSLDPRLLTRRAATPSLPRYRGIV